MFHSLRAINYWRKRMGYILHHAIIITSFDEKRIKEAREEAINIGCTVSEIVKSKINRYCSFFVAPDGSKEGWDHSDEGNSQREKLINYVKRDGIFDWVEIQYGDEAGASKITKDSNENSY